MKFAKSLWHLSCGVILIVTLLQNCVQSSFIGIVDIPASLYPTSIYDERTHCGIRQEYPCLGAIKDFSSAHQYDDCVFMAELLVPSAVVGQDTKRHRFFIKFVDHQDTRLEFHEFLIEKLAINTIPCGVNCLRYNKAYCSSGNCISHQEITFEFSFLLPVTPSCKAIVINNDFNSTTRRECGVDPTTKPCPLYFKHFPNRLGYIDSAGKKNCYKVRFRINVCSPLSACVSAPFDQWEYIELHVYLVNSSQWATLPELEFGVGVDRTNFNELIVDRGLELCVDGNNTRARYFISSVETCELGYTQTTLQEGFLYSLSEILDNDFELKMEDCQFV